MARKLIHSKFEIDLGNFQISDATENNWFSDTFFSRYSFPFNIDLEEDLDVALGFISRYNTFPETLYPLKYVEDNVISDAEFEVQEVNDNVLQCVYETGLDEFPSWNKKLSELSLFKIVLPHGTTIYQYAAAMVNKVWPEVNFCFPAVHIDYIDTEDNYWLDFEGTVNNYKDDAFIENVFVGNNSINKNIMQPAIFALYILQRGFADEGFELAGDILGDPTMQKLAFFSPTEYYKKREPIEIPVFNDYTHPIGQVLGSLGYIPVHLTIVDVPIWGRYLIVGTISTYGVYGSNTPPENGPTAGIAFNDTLIWSAPDLVSNNSWNIEVEFISTSSPINNLSVRANSVHGYTNEIGTFYKSIELTVVLIEEYDVDGHGIPSIQNEDKVDLTKAVADMTFGEYVKVIKNWFNYDFTPVGNQIVMNRIQDEINFVDAMDLSHWEVKNPTRRFQKGMSFNLKFRDVTIPNEATYKYTFKQVYQSAAGYVYENFKTDTKTSIIEIDAIPLPLLVRNEIKTAHCFEDDQSKLYGLLYTGIVAGKNMSQDPAPIEIPAVHLKYWWKWFSFRINSIGFKWVFKAFGYHISNLHVKRKVFAYGNYHLIKSLIRTEIKPDIFEVEIDTESLK